MIRYFESAAVNLRRLRRLLQVIEIITCGGSAAVRPVNPHTPYRRICAALKAGMRQKGEVRSHVRGDTGEARWRRRRGDFSRSYQTEWSYMLGLRGYAWDKTKATCGHHQVGYAENSADPGRDRTCCRWRATSFRLQRAGSGRRVQIVENMERINLRPSVSLSKVYRC